MECIRISDSKIKLTLGPDEVEKYDFEPVKNGEERANGSFLSGFRRILRDVRRDTGFDAGGKRVLVRYFYGKDGGCEMYITKLRDVSRGEGVKNLNGAYLWGGSTSLPREEQAENVQPKAFKVTKEDIKELQKRLNSDSISEENL